MSIEFAPDKCACLLQIVACLFGVAHFQITIFPNIAMKIGPKIDMPKYFAGKFVPTLDFARRSQAPSSRNRATSFKIVM